MNAIIRGIPFQFASTPDIPYHGPPVLFPTVAGPVSALLVVEQIDDAMAIVFEEAPTSAGPWSPLAANATFQMPIVGFDPPLYGATTLILLRLRRSMHWMRASTSTVLEGFDTMGIVLIEGPIDLEVISAL